MKARPGPRLILDQALADKIMKLVAYGVKTEAICERFGISKWAVYQAKYKSSMGGVRKYYPPKEGPRSQRAGAVREGSTAQKPT